MSTIVVVDDDREVGRLMRVLFEMKNHDVVWVSTYRDIVPTVRQVLPDVVVLDVKVQGQETIDLVRQMQQDEHMAHIPVVMSSGLDCSQRCLEAGADLFVLKPFLPNQLIETVIGLLK